MNIKYYWYINITTTYRHNVSYYFHKIIYKFQKPFWMFGNSTKSSWIKYRNSMQFRRFFENSLYSACALLAHVGWRMVQACATLVSAAHRSAMVQSHNHCSFLPGSLFPLAPVTEFCSAICSTRLVDLQWPYIGLDVDATQKRKKCQYVPNVDQCNVHISLIGQV